MRNTLSNLKLTLCAAVIPFSITCASDRVYPVPQSVTYGKQTLAIESIRKINYNAQLPVHLKEQISTILGENGGTANSPKQTEVVIGIRGEKAVRKYSKLLPGKAEGYYIRITPGQIIVMGEDTRGLFYALQTLKQLKNGDQLPLTEIKDYPDIAFRGVVEGFYGTPWSHEARLRQLQFYGEMKMNTYIYGPKDDPYHSSPNWRVAYPEKEAKQLKELVDCARKNEVDFVWAIHPGLDIKWTDADRDLVLQKFEAMYALGVRSYAVFFDDISGEGTKADKQAALLNYIDNHFVQVKKDVKPLIMCPTEYNKSWSNPAGGYLRTLGEQLNPSVQIMWTGDRVISDITEDGVAWITDQIKREPYIWWNFPVSDYVRDHLLMGRVYGLDTHIGAQMSGFVTNPMERPEASKPAIFSVADYAWNPDGFDSNQSWEDAIDYVIPSRREAMRTFAEHHSDLGPNGHGYRREESVAIAPVAERFLSAATNNGWTANDYRLLTTEFGQLGEAADLLLADEHNPMLIEEMKPWLLQSKVVAEAGMEVLSMAEALRNGEEEMFRRKYNHVVALQKRYYLNDREYNQNPYQPGVKSGSLVMKPFADSLFVYTTRAFNKQYGAQLPYTVFTSPHKSYSTVAQAALLPVRVRNKRISVSPLLEVIRWKENEWIGIELDKKYALQRVEADFGITDANDWLACEISEDGMDWQPVNFTQVKQQMKFEVNNQAKYIRFKNTTAQEREARLRRFEVILD
ncbi:MAG: beta-N-acetylglucosaminidase [Bacteroidales bacterium]